MASSCAEATDGTGSTARIDALMKVTASTIALKILTDRPCKALIFSHFDIEFRAARNAWQDIRLLVAKSSRSSMW
jgi:hypothetical protein